MHAPWYNSNYNHQGEGEAMRVAMEELLYEHGVDVVFAGECSLLVFLSSPLTPSLPAPGRRAAPGPCRAAPRAALSILPPLNLPTPPAGHVHAYERAHRVLDGQLDECAPLYM